MRRSKKSLGSAILVSLLSASMVVMMTPASVFAKTFTENEITTEGNISDGIVAPPKSDITVNGSVNATPGTNEKISADNATVKIRDDVKADITAENGATVTVGKDVDGNITIRDDEESEKTNNVTVGNNVNGNVDNNLGNVTIKGNLNGSLENNNGTATVNGNVTASKATTGDHKDDLLCVGNYNGTVTVSGDANMKCSNGGSAVDVGTWNDGKKVKTNTYIGGNVNATSTNTILGNTEYSRNVYSDGINIVADTGETNVTVKGNVNVTSNSFSTGIGIMTDGYYDEEENADIKKVVVNVTTGSVNVAGKKELTDTNGEYCTDVTNAIDISTNANSEVNVLVNGDAISSGNNAIKIENYSAKNNTTSVTIDGTLESSKEGIVITNYSDDNSPVNLTVWKIKSDSSNNVAVYKGAEHKGETAKLDEAESKKQSENINYIIRHDGTISLEGTDSITVNDKKFETARESKKLTIHVKVEDEKKYRVDRVEGGTATATKNADGSWTLTVPKNGGVDIRAVLVAIEQNENHGSSSSSSGSSGSSSSSSSGGSGSSGTGAGGAYTTLPNMSKPYTGSVTTTSEGATVQTNVTEGDTSSVTDATIKIGTSTANVSTVVSNLNGTKVSFQNSTGNLAGASFKGVGQISADGTTLVKEDGTTAKMATGMLLAIENADGTSIGCFVDATGKTIATGAFEVYYMLGTDGKLHAHFVNPQGYFMTGIQVINGQTVTFNAVGEMVSVL